MSPNTFSNLKESKRNSAQDYVQVAGSLGASHLLRVSCNEKNIPHMHLSRMPAGPSFDFRIERFSLVSDIRSQLQSGSAAMSREDERFAPVAILNGFKSANDQIVSLLGEALKGLIPAIDISKINVKTCRRVILFNFTAETNTLSIRHYRISLARKTLATMPEASAPAQSCGVILNARKSSRIPNLGHLVSISELVTPKADLEAENPQSQVEIVTKSSSKRTTSLSLTEIGPRIETSLSRVLAGVEEGAVLFSKFAPETMGSTITKKKPKRVFKSDDKVSKKKRRTDDELAADDDDYGSLMSE
jgi:ribosome biogenesis protein SSF1/2